MRLNFPFVGTTLTFNCVSILVKLIDGAVVPESMFPVVVQLVRVQPHHNSMLGPLKIGFVSK
jgi:hypothetical protein